MLGESCSRQRLQPRLPSGAVALQPRVPFFLLFSRAGSAIFGCFHMRGPWRACRVSQTAMLALLALIALLDLRDLLEWFVVVVVVVVVVAVVVVMQS